MQDSNLQAGQLACWSAAHHCWSADEAAGVQCAVEDQVAGDVFLANFLPPNLLLAPPTTHSGDPLNIQTLEEQNETNFLDGASNMKEIPADRHSSKCQKF